MKKSKQPSAQAVSQKQRGKESRRESQQACSNSSLPAWPSLAQLRDRLQSSAVGEADGYRFEQSLR
ncbi:hypothetical protein [Polaromonas sp.]|uniref:hypothetical protein n=1 Tax=Polaromonas sp. TaxID=1869339 RepID=UPI0017D8E334|nr:hypothetical protein [Polaromonas sp.]NMM06282.1 hypothetical protein [Polaromonas sp.]